MVSANLLNNMEQAVATNHRFLNDDIVAEVPVASDSLIASIDEVDQPHDNCCYLYNDDWFSGDKKQFCIYGSERIISLRYEDSNFDNKMDSIYCGAKVAATYCSRDWN
jgi:hypothetical protein